MTLSPAQKYINDFSNLVHANSWRERNDSLAQMEALYGKLDPASNEGIVLGFALAKIYDDLGEIDGAFNMLQKVNAHHRSGKTDTIEDARDTISRVRQLFSSQQVKQFDHDSNPKPIFVLGMPRSGTTLVEQILASHSQVHGGGELKFMGEWCFGFLKLQQERGDILLNDYLGELQRHYHAGISSLSNKRFVSDKMPVNFLWLGFILAAFPNARIVHTQRDAMATCWSIYKTPFAGSSNGYSCSLDDIGEFYQLYVQLMQFWNDMFPGKIYGLNYERLTIDQRKETRKLLAFCDLDWEPQCLAFHKNTREVTTASWAQVKRPMYQGSSESWRRFEKHLDPLKEKIGGTSASVAGNPES